MDRLPRPPDAELVDLLEEEREAAAAPGPESAPDRGSGARSRLRVEGALPLEAFLREIEDPAT